MSAGCEGCKTLQAEMNQQADELAGMARAIRHATLQEQAWRRKWQEACEEDPSAELVRELLELWRVEVMQGSTRVNVKLGGPRGNRCKWAIKHYRKNGGMDVLKEAIMGATLDDYAMGRDPRTKGRRSNDIADNLFKSEASIEKFARQWRNHQTNMAGGGVRAPRARTGGMAALPSEAALAGFVRDLQDAPNVLERLKASKGWEAATLEKLGVGWYGNRLLFPIRDEAGVLVNVVQYASKLKPKSLALSGRPRGLWPAPETLGESVMLTEGEPDAVTAHGLGLDGCAVPGTSGWQDRWRTRFAGRKVVVVFDCDKVGREAAHRVAESLAPVAASVRVLDLDRHRTDGWDLSDAVRAGMGLTVLRELVIATPVVQRTEAA